MTRFYPVFLNLQGRKCLIVGAGDVAWRKAERLVECGALVTVVGRTPSGGILGMKQTGLVGHVDEDYRAGLLEDAFLVIGATDDEAVNRRVHADAEAAGKLVNIVDRPELCNFIVPALSRRGDLTVAVSTAGRSPAMARRIRDDIEARLDEGYGPFLELMGALRKRILARGQSSDQNRVIFEALADSDLLGLVRDQRWDEVRERVYRLTGEIVSVPAILHDHYSPGDDD